MPRESSNSAAVYLGNKVFGDSYRTRGVPLEFRQAPSDATSSSNLAENSCNGAQSKMLSQFDQAEPSAGPVDVGKNQTQQASEAQPVNHPPHMMSPYPPAFGANYGYPYAPNQTFIPRNAAPMRPSPRSRRRTHGASSARSRSDPVHFYSHAPPKTARDWNPSYSPNMSPHGNYNMAPPHMQYYPGPQYPYPQPQAQPQLPQLKNTQKSGNNQTHEYVNSQTESAFSQEPNPQESLDKQHTPVKFEEPSGYSGYPTAPQNTGIDPYNRPPAPTRQAWSSGPTFRYFRRIIYDKNDLDETRSLSKKPNRAAKEAIWKKKKTRRNIYYRPLSIVQATNRNRAIMSRLYQTRHMPRFGEW